MNVIWDEMCEISKKIDVGRDFEEKGMVDEAIKNYEDYVRKIGFGLYPYERLIDIYHKRKQYNEEKRIIQCTINMLSKLLEITPVDAKSRKRVESNLNSYKKLMLEK